MWRHPDRDSGSSPIVAVLLLVGITIVLAMLVLILCNGLLSQNIDSSVPVIFRITSVKFITDSGGTGVRGFVTLTNTASKNYQNRYLGVVTYVNGRKADCNIPTLNNQLFCSLNHYGVWHLYGVGTWGNKDSPTSVWPGHSDIAIEYRNGIMRPGDHLAIEVIDTTTGRIISRDTYPQGSPDAQWFYRRFLNPQAA